MTSRRWFPYAVTAGLYCGVVLIAWLFFHDALEQQQQRQSLSSRERTYLGLESALRKENTAFRAIVLRDSIVPLIPARPGVLALVHDRSTTSGYLEQLLSREVGRLPKAAVGVAGAPASYGSHPGVKQTWSRTVYLNGNVGTVPFCVAVLPTWHDVVQLDVARVSGLGVRVLGSCVFWGRYGAPGPQIARWLAAGGEQFARMPEPIKPGEADWEGPRSLLSRLTRPRWEASLRGQACLAGKINSCTDALLHADTLLSDRSLVYDGPSYQPRLFYGETHLLGSLEEQFGSARFESFWTSSKPVPAAFEEAFGVPMGQWVHDWSSGVLWPLQAGASVTAGTVVLSLLLLGITVGATAGIARRRAL